MALPPQNSILSRKMVGIKIIKKHTSSLIPLSYWIIILSYVFCLLLAVIRVIFKSMKSLFAPTHCSGPAGWNKEQGFPSTPQLPQKHFMQCCCCGSQDVPCLISSFSTRRCAWLSSLQINHQPTSLLFCLSVYLSSFHPRLSLWMLLRLLFSHAERISGECHLAHLFICSCLLLI